MTRSLTADQPEFIARPVATRRQLLKSAAALGAAAPFIQVLTKEVGAASGGTAVVANYAMPADLEPGKIPNFMEWFVLQNIGEGLTAIFQAADGAIQVQPLLADSYTQSSDGRTWTFKLKQGVTFHDGSVFDAQAVVFSHDRLMNSSNPYYDPAFDQFGLPLNAMIEKITALDAATVEFTLKPPVNPYFLNWEAFILAVSPTAVAKFGKTFGVNVVGTGPFQLSKFDAAGNSIEIVKNPKYWQANLPQLDKVIWQAVAEPATRLAMLETGDADVAATMPPELADRIKGNPDLGLNAAVVPNFNAIAFYLTQPPFDNPKLRQALAYALDRKALADTLYAGLWTPAINNRWPGMTGWEDYQPFPHDPDKAKALLKEVGVESGLAFTLDMPSSSSGNPAGTRWGELIQSQLSEVGITVTLNPVESASFWTSINTPRPNTAFYYTRQVYIGDVVNEWISLWITPPTGLQSISAVPGLADLATELQQATAKDAYDAVVTKMWKVLDDELPYIALADGSWLTGMRQALKDFKPQGIGAYLPFTNSHLD